MSDLINKISSYHLFNYLLPGTLFVAFGERITDYHLIQDDIVVSLFLYYFIGLVISRIGSLMLEPALKKLKILEFSPYNEFLAASKIDPKIDILSESNNMYRTLCALFISLGALKIYEQLAIRCEFLNSLIPYILLASLFGLFVFSYRKQTKFIVKRVTNSRD